MNISKEILERIQKTIIEIETKNEVTILYAIESGSRSWGFESPDSDYDVRFIYVHKTPKWYITIAPSQQDTIIYSSDDNLMDFHGWDIRKALYLLSQSNPSIIEWIQSHIIYQETHQFRQKCLILLSKMKPNVPLIWHYYSMAAENYRDFLFGRDVVNLKKYLYVIRPVAHLQWFLENDSFRFSLKFDDILQQIKASPEVKNEITKLVEIKKSKQELGTGKKNEIIDKWITQILGLWEERSKTKNLSNRLGVVSSFQKVLAKKDISEALLFLFLYENQEQLPRDSPSDPLFLLNKIQNIELDAKNALQEFLKSQKPQKQHPLYQEGALLHKWIHQNIIANYKPIVNKIHSEVLETQKKKKQENIEESLSSVSIEDFDQLLFNFVIECEKKN